MYYKKDELVIRSTSEKDIPILLKLIKELAEYEKLSQSVVSTEELLSNSLFGNEKSAKALIAEVDGKAAGMAIYFFNFSMGELARAEAFAAD
jgi:N-acetylglutamate synthase-like GNAT family acetyltransferase